MDLYLGGLIIWRLFASEILGAYFWRGLLPEFYGILIKVLLYQSRKFLRFRFQQVEHFDKEYQLFANVFYTTLFIGVLNLCI